MDWTKTRILSTEHCTRTWPWSASPHVGVGHDLALAVGDYDSPSKKRGGLFESRLHLIPTGEFRVVLRDELLEADISYLLELALEALDLSLSGDFQVETHAPQRHGQHQGKCHDHPEL